MPAPNEPPAQLDAPDFDCLTEPGRVFRSFSNDNRPQAILDCHISLAVSAPDEVKEFLVLEIGGPMVISCPEDFFAHLDFVNLDPFRNPVANLDS